MVSVIISIYNTSPFLRQCVRSITRQDYRDLEILLINDKSTDNSLEICNRLALEDNRIRVIDLAQNVGLAKNRFIGLEQASGEYVTFVDSDDWIVGKSCLSALVAEADRTGVDYVEMGMQRVMDRWALIKWVAPKSVNGVIESPQLFDDYYLSFFGVSLLSVNICGKLYRRDLLLKAALKPWKYAMGEDLYFNMHLFPQLKRISITDTVGYSYRFGGMTSRHNPALFDSMVELYQIKKKKIEEYDYQKAHDFIRFEIKNVLRSDICQAIGFYKDEAKVRDLISRRLALDIWDDLRDIRDMGKTSDADFTEAVMRRDADKVYDICLAQERSRRKSRMLKRAIGFFCKYI